MEKNKDNIKKKPEFISSYKESVFKNIEDAELANLKKNIENFYSTLKSHLGKTSKNFSNLRSLLDTGLTTSELKNKVLEINSYYKEFSKGIHAGFSHVNTSLREASKISKINEAAMASIRDKSSGEYKAASDRFIKSQEGLINEIIRAYAEFGDEINISDDLKKVYKSKSFKEKGLSLSWMLGSNIDANIDQLSKGGGWGISKVKQLGYGAVHGIDEVVKGIPGLGNLLSKFSTFAVASSLVANSILKLIDTWDFHRSVKSYSYGITGSFGFGMGKAIEGSPLAPTFDKSFVSKIGLDWKEYSRKTLSQLEETRVLSGKDSFNRLSSSYKTIQEHSIMLNRFGLSFDSALPKVIQGIRLFGETLGPSSTLKLATSFNMLSLSFDEGASAFGSLEENVVNYGKNFQDFMMSFSAAKDKFGLTQAGSAAFLRNIGGAMASMDFVRQIGLISANTNVDPLKYARYAFPSQNNDHFKNLRQSINNFVSQVDEEARGMAYSKLLNINPAYAYSNLDRITEYFAGNLDRESEKKLREEFDKNSLDKSIEKMSLMVSSMDKITGIVQSIFDLLARLVVTKKWFF